MRLHPPSSEIVPADVLAEAQRLMARIRENPWWSAELSCSQARQNRFLLRNQLQVSLADAGRALEAIRQSLEGHKCSPQAAVEAAYQVLIRLARLWRELEREVEGHRSSAVGFRP
jgi:hypothetical protein